jgi:hypothetical protein
MASGPFVSTDPYNPRPSSFRTSRSRTAVGSLRARVVGCEGVVIRDGLSAFSVEVETSPRPGPALAEYSGSLGRLVFGGMVNLLLVDPEIGQLAIWQHVELVEPGRAVLDAEVSFDPALLVIVGKLKTVQGL